MHWTRTYKARGNLSVLPMTTRKHSPQNVCFGKPSSLRRSWHFPALQGTCGCRHTIQWWEVCWCHFEATRGFDHRFADFKTHRVTFQIFASPISFDDDAPCVLQMKLIKLQWNSKWRSGRWVEKPTSLGIFWENWPLASFGFPECSSGPCAFLEARTSAKSSSPPWTSISPSTRPDLLMNIFKTYWGSQLLPPSGQTSHDMPIWH